MRVDVLPINDPGFINDIGKANAMKTPLAIFTYNRDAHTKMMLEYLSNCYRLNECEIVIFCDGPKDVGHTDATDSTRAVVQSWAKNHRAQVILREENLGLKRSIELGVSELCSKYGRIIVLEDDLLVSPYFIDYMLRALDFYEHDSRVMQVSGFTFPFQPSTQQSVFLMPIVTTWGWATWHRAWNHFDPDPKEAVKDLQDPQKSNSFDLNGVYPYHDMIKKVHIEQLSSWGVLFWYAVWKQRGLVAYPKNTLVENIGFDGSGVNCGPTGKKWAEDLQNFGKEIPSWEFPVESDLVSFNELRSFLSRDATKPKNLAQKIKNLSRFLLKKPGLI